MTVREYKHFFRQQLQPLLGEREAQSVARLVFEKIDVPGGLSPESSYDAQRRQQLDSALEALLKGAPVQYVLGEAYFYDFRLSVNPSVLIPRPETEELVSWVITTAKAYTRPAPRLLDIGTGSGCIALACKRHLPIWTIEAMDASPQALQTARENAAALGLAIDCWQGDITRPDQLREPYTAAGRYDIIVSNPPYILEAEAASMPAQVVDFEPAMALFTGNEDPLYFYKKIMTFAARALQADGYLFFECSEYYADQLSGLAECKAFEQVEMRHDLQGKPRMWRARRKTC
jgi:release factor glutamine methyltransferase